MSQKEAHDYAARDITSLDDDGKSITWSCICGARNGVWFTYGIAPKFTRGICNACGHESPPLLDLLPMRSR